MLNLQENLLKIENNMKTDFFAESILSKRGRTKKCPE